MRLAFFLQRNTELKAMGGLIEAAAARGHECAIFFQEEPEDVEKSYQSLSAQQLKHFGGVEIYGAAELPALFARLRDWEPEIFFAQEGYHALKAPELQAEIRSCRAQGTRFVSLPHFFEIANRPLEALDLFDLTLYTSEFGRDLHFDIQSKKAQPRAAQAAYADRFAVAGSPMFDQLRQLDANQSRAKLDVPAGRKVVLLMAPVLLSTTPWRHIVWRGAGSRLARTWDAVKNGHWEFLPEIWTGPTFKECIHSLRNFCDREGALLMVKSRGKHKDPDYLVDAADIYLDGYTDSFYPLFTTYQLLAAADLCITVNSMSALEAVAAEVPVVNIYVPHLDRAFYRDAKHQAYFDTILNPKKPGPFSASGCVINIDRRQFPHWLQGASLEELGYEREARQAYLHQFLGIEQEPSSSVILDMIESVQHKQQVLVSQE